MNCLNYTSAVPQPFLLLIAANLIVAWCLGWKWAYNMCRIGWRVNRSKLYFSWPDMIFLMIWYTSKMSALHLSRSTSIFVVDCCQIGPNWIFGLKMELMACANLVGGTTNHRCLFLALYDSIKDMKLLLFINIAPHRATAIFVVDCFKFGPSWIFELKIELMACADLVGGSTEKICLFPELIW